MNNFESPSPIESWSPREEAVETSVNKFETKRYEGEAGGVDVSWREVKPSQKTEGQDGKAVVFLPGWAMESDARSTEKLVSAFAE